MTLLISKLYVRSNKHRNDVFGLTRSMFANQVEMIVERGFPLLRRINQILAAMRDMGIMSKLSNDFNYNMTILTPIREMKSRGSAAAEQLPEDVIGEVELDHAADASPEIVLTVEHLEGAFTILIMGLIVSFAVFILEHIAYSRVVQRALKWFCWKVLCCHSKPDSKSKTAPKPRPKHWAKLKKSS